MEQKVQVRPGAALVVTVPIIPASTPIGRCANGGLCNSNDTRAVWGLFACKNMLHCRSRSQQDFATLLLTIPRFFSLILIVRDASQPFATNEPDRIFCSIVP